MSRSVAAKSTVAAQGLKIEDLMPFIEVSAHPARWDRK
jgi:hypothetical protein